MTLQEETPQQNPFEDQRKQALELYEKMAKECHHYSSFIQRAIESYNPDLQAQLSSKEQENERLTIMATDAELLRTKLDYKTEENKRNILSINELRKRCEDLEAALDEVFNYAVATGHGIDDELEVRCRKLLNQIKS